MSWPDTSDPGRAPSDVGGAPHQLVEHFFRRQSGRLVATLTRVLGARRLELVEDVVQAALLQALRSWGTRGVPDDPAAWLFRVAKNLAVDALRRERVWEDRLRSELAADERRGDPFLEQVQAADEIPDDQLRLLCLCCHPALAAESQVALALRTLGGFSTPEIARALLTSEANAQKRIVRAKERLRSEPLGDLTEPDIAARLPMLLSAIYLLFNEGYNSGHPDRLIRGELCAEALRLADLLAAHPVGRTPATCALIALMSFHAARFESRSEEQTLVLLEDQDRALWDQDLIGEGVRWLAEAAEGQDVSQYHIEAAIAAEHCLAPDFASTPWPRIVAWYDRLIAERPTALNALNRAIALSYVQGPAAALAELAEIDAASAPREYPLWDAVVGELERRAGNAIEARRRLQSALENSTSRSEQALLRRRLAGIDAERS